MDSIIAGIKAGDESAILQLGRLESKASVPFLKQLYAQPNKAYGSASSLAQMALAKLGQKEQFDEIVRELDSSDPGIQENATKKLTYVGGTDAIRALIRQLDKTEWRKAGSDADKKLPPNERPLDKVFFVPLSFAAMRALAEIAPNPPVATGTEPSDEHIPLWRKWWADIGSKLK